MNMFGLVVLNNMYSFSAIVTLFLISLALGGFLAYVLCRNNARPWNTLSILLLFSGIAVGLTPLLFFYLTDSMAPLNEQDGWAGYVRSIFSLSAMVILLPGIVVGSIFPFLLKGAWNLRTKVGETLGVWISINTIGSIFGALFTGFVLMKFLGLWTSIGLMASLYFALFIIISENHQSKAIAKRFIPALILIVIMLFVIPERLPLVRIYAENKDEIKGMYYGSDGVTTVIQSHLPQYPEGFNDLSIRINNLYTLGGVGGLAHERRQAHLPLFLHPNPHSVFIIGLGTGITAGGALYHPIDHLIATEVIPEAADAARDHFGAYTNGLFEDKRATVIIEDGRNYLMGTKERFDVIIGDLFNPWASGVGNLYTREHFQSIKESLSDGGIFVQWLPLYETSKQEFGIITRTFLDVFNSVTLWRGNFVPNKPMVALAGWNNPHSLDPAALLSNVEALYTTSQDNEVLIDALISVKGLGVLVANPEKKDFLAERLPGLIQSVPFTFYAGNISQNAGLFSEYPVSTDDKPIIEFLSPKTRGNVQKGDMTFFTEFELLEFFEELFSAVPPNKDPYLKNLTPQQIGYVEAGLSYYKSLLFVYAGTIFEDKSMLETGQTWFAEYLKRMGLDTLQIE